MKIVVDGAVKAGEVICRELSFGNREIMNVSAHLRFDDASAILANGRAAR